METIAARVLGCSPLFRWVVLFCAGLTGTYFMTKLLMESGRNDLIFTYANQTTFPSYGYFLQKGYTTWPEQWNVASGDSLMHGCYNGIGLWFGKY